MDVCDGILVSREVPAIGLGVRLNFRPRYSLKKCNSTTIFEDNQANLEQAVEDLSEMLERPITPATIPEIREKVTNKTAFVQKRSDIILQDTLMGNWEVCPRAVLEVRCVC